MVGGRAESAARRAGAGAWRPGRRAGRCRIRPEEHQELPRLLRRLLDGAAAGRSGADRTDAEVQADRPALAGKKTAGRGPHGEENMSGVLIGQLILWLIVAIIVIAIIVYLVNWLYHRSSKEVSFVRTGLYGERVVINGGAFVLPFIHDYTPVNMNVLQMEIVREQADALITRDRMRVDIEAEFYVRVQPTRSEERRVGK